MESFIYVKRQNWHLLLNFEHIRGYPSLILLRQSNHLILWGPHFLLLAIILDVLENACNILKISHYVLPRTYLRF